MKRIFILLVIISSFFALITPKVQEEIFPNIQPVLTEELKNVEQAEPVASEPQPSTETKEVVQPVETPKRKEDTASAAVVPTPAPAKAVQQPPQLAAQEVRKQVQDYAASIGLADAWYAIDFIYTKESSWNPYAVNKTSGACGLNQELPCGKSGCALGDYLCQFRWGTNYANGRYGSWHGAYNAWRSKNWW